MGNLLIFMIFQSESGNWRSKTGKADTGKAETGKVETGIPVTRKVET